MAFNLSMMVFATSSASLIFHGITRSSTLCHSSTLGLALGTVTLFLAQTAPVASIVAISESRSARKVWFDLAQLVFPYYVVSAGVTSMVQAMTSHLGWGLALAVFPVMYVIHRSYRMYFKAMTEAEHPQLMVRVAGAGA
jgi:hypothetical protein